MKLTREIEFLLYQQQIHDLYEGDIRLRFEVDFRSERCGIWTWNDEKNNSDYYVYTTEKGTNDSVEDNHIYTYYDPDLVKAEEHIQRLIEAKSKGETNEGDAVSG